MTVNTVHLRLRQATVDAHARVDAVVGGSLDSVDGYGAYLRGMHGFISASAAALPASSGHIVTAPGTWLAEDLDVLQLRPLQPAAPVRRLDDRAAQLGWEYVVAGASVGARYLLRGAQALGFGAGTGASFLSGHARSSTWPDFLATLDREALPGPAVDRACRAAALAFDAAERAFTMARREAVQ